MVSTACPVCAGKRPFCIHKSYPLPRDFNLQKQVEEKLGKDFFGPSYSVFVGHYGYPNVNVGPLSALEGAGTGPASWFGKGYKEIITEMSFVVRAKQKESVFSRARVVADVQELAIAKRPTDTEISYKKQPHYKFSLSDSLQPMGPSAELDKLRLAENVKVDPKVERIVTDEMKAAEASFELYSHGQDVYKITTILSSGVLGMQDSKKLVPTRWSITAMDDIIAKRLISEVRSFPQAKDFMVFEFQYMDNHFVTLVMPGNWEFENFEVWAPGSNWSDERLGKAGSALASRIIPEHEPFGGRKAYAESQAGGYYASRIAAVEYLHGIRKQAKVVTFREVYEGYVWPLGVWVVRETARKAFANPRKFGTRQEALAYAASRLRVPLGEYRKKSKVLGRKTLADFGQY